ncbi:MAG: right-handed parallel beta-helix repeat-containing protein [bacterium]
MSKKKYNWLIMAMAILVSSGAEARPGKPMLISDKFIMTDTVWEGTVIVSGLVKVAAKASLKIRPGSRILFTGNKKGTNALFVQGNLTAMGTLEKPIIFTSHEPEPRKGDWSGINLIASDRLLNKMSFCRISFARVGLHCHFSLLSVSDCTFTNNKRGIYFQDMKADIRRTVIAGNYSGLRGRGAQLSLTGCVFSGNYWGMDLNGSQAGLADNRFLENLLYGLRLRNCRAALKGNRFNHNRIGLRSLKSGLQITGGQYTGNEDIGIMLLESHAMVKQTDFRDNANQGILVNQGALDISGSSITGNREGIQIKEARSVFLRDCLINSNLRRGISAHSSGLTLKENQIKGNGLSGIRIKGQGKAVLEKNRIRENKKHGISLEEARPLIKDNLVEGNREDGIAAKRSDPVITGNRITGNYHIGVRLEKNKAVLLQDNRVSSNRESGVYSNETSGLIKNNRISSNRFHGLESRLSDLSVAGNRINGNGKSGISDSGSLLLIDQNRISRNRAFGISFQETESAVLTANRINSNQRFGVSLVEVENGSLTENRIQGNQDGVLVDRSPLAVSGNQILDSGEYALKLLGPDDLEASNNWWGTEEEEEMSKIIYDFEDDVDSGEVFYDPVAPDPHQ